MNPQPFTQAKPLVGVLELLSLPGSALWQGRMDRVIARAEQEAAALATGGVDALLIENTDDAPFGPHRMDTAGAIAMGLIIRRIMNFTDLPIGVNVLRNDPETALAIAMNVNAKFIRVDLLTGAAVGDSGILEGRHAALTAYRQRIHAEGIALYADIGLNRMLAGTGLGTGIAALVRLAREAVTIGGANGIILTDPDLDTDTIAAVTAAMDVPVLYDYPQALSQVTPYLEAAGGLVISRGIKKTAHTGDPDGRPTVDLTKVEELTAMVEVIRSQPTGRN